jgi:DNA-binding MarR family transcriptional regulator
MQDPQIEELITLLFSTSRLVRESMKPTNTTDSFTPLRMGTLRYIAESKNPTMQEVAKFLSITAPSATSLIDGLIQAGVISRNSSTSDRRIVHLEITAKGSQTLEKARKAMVV